MIAQLYLSTDKLDASGISETPEITATVTSHWNPTEIDLPAVSTILKH